MKKVKIQSKLSLDKMTIAELNDYQTSEIVGGKGFLSIGKSCSCPDECGTSNATKGIWCK